MLHIFLVEKDCPGSRCNVAWEEISNRAYLEGCNQAKLERNVRDEVRAPNSLPSPYSETIVSKEGHGEIFSMDHGEAHYTTKANRFGPNPVDSSFVIARGSS